MNSLPPWLLVTGDFVKTGGMDIANYMLARHLAAKGHEVHLVAHRVADDLAALPGVRVHRVPKPLNSYLLGAPLLDWHGRRWARAVARRGGRVVVNGGNCQWGDVNWVHYVHAAYEPQVRGSLLRRVKARWQHHRFLAGERRALARARRVIANSRATKRALVERLGLPAKRIEVVYYGIDADAFRPPTPPERRAARAALGWPEGRLKAVFIGALGDRRKGFDLLFEAWRQLCADPAWDVDLAVVGTGAELPAWRARAVADPALRGRVEFLGFRRDVPAILAAADVAVAPARYEAYGLGVQEALCCAVPAVVSAGAGVAERYPGGLRNLLIDEPPSAAALSARLGAWRENRETAAGLADFSPGLRSRSWDDMAGEMTAAVGEAPAPAASQTGSSARRAKVLGGFLSVQLVVQALNFVCGLLLVRNLVKQEYAFYTVAMSMQGVLAVLSECGVTIAVTSIGGRVWQDRYRFGQLINTAQGFRNRLAAAAALLVGPLLVLLLRQNGCPWPYALGLTATVLATGCLQLSVGTLLRVPLLHSQVAQVQKLDLAWAGSRLALVGAALGLRWLNAALATLATLGSYGLQRFWLGRLVREKIDPHAPPHPEDRRALAAIFKTQVANALYYCTQGQITIWLLSWLGNTAAVADLGALARFGLLGSLVGSVMNTLVQPAFARCQSRARLRALYLEAIGGLLLLGLALVAAALLFPGLFLGLLGRKYLHLRLELVLAMAGLAIGMIGAATGALNSARGWVRLAWLYAPLTIAGQALLLCVLNVGHLPGAIIFGALTPLPGTLLNFFLAADGFRHLPLDSCKA